MKAKKFAQSAVAGIVLATVPALAVRASDMPASFAGKTVTILVAAGAGGAYGLHARLLAQYLGRNLDGTPNVVTQFMPGASGVVAANQLYNAASKDGTAIAMFTTAVPVADALGESAVKYKSAKFNWIGSMADTLGVMVFWHTAPAKTVDEARKVQSAVGSTGRSGNTYRIPALMNKVLGTKFKIVLGYRGTADMTLAMERGEIHGGNSTWSAVKASHGNLLREGKLVPMAQIGLKKAPDLQHVPLLLDFARTPAEREVIEFASMQYELGFIIAAPPGVPEVRLGPLKRAVAASLRDPGLLADAKRLKMSIDYVPGEAIEQIVHRIVGAPKSVIERVKAAIR